METIITKNFISTILLAAVASSPAMALTWAELKSTALDHAPALEIAKSELSAADATIKSANAQFLPNISSSLSASQNIDTSTHKSANNYDASILVEQSLFSFGRSAAQLDAAKSGKSASLANLKLSSVTLRTKLARAWAKALYLQELGRISEKNIARREANAQIVKLRYQGGRENKGSVLKTETATLETKTDTFEAKDNFELSKGDLSVLIGKDIDPSETLAGEIVPDLQITVAKPSREHPEVTALHAKEKQAEAALKESRRKYLPDLALSASARRSATPNLPLNDPEYTAGLTLRIPMFTPSTSADIASAAAKRKSASVALKEAQSSHSQKMKSAESSLKFAQQRLEIANKSFDASKLQAEVSRQRYTLGLVSFQDWDSYESDLMKSEADVLRCKLEVANAHADYIEALGINLEEGP